MFITSGGEIASHVNGSLNDVVSLIWKLIEPSTKERFKDGAIIRAVKGDNLDVCSPYLILDNDLNIVCVICADHGSAFLIDPIQLAKTVLECSYYTTHSLTTHSL